MSNNTQETTFESFGNTFRCVFIQIDPDTYEGGIPTGSELVARPANTQGDADMVLYGFDEITPQAGVVFGFAQLTITK